jgi:hypothetical protein
MNLSTMERNRKSEDAIVKAKNFRKDSSTGENYTLSKVICSAKRIIFEENQSGDLKINGANKMRNYVTLQQAVRYIVEEVMELTPEEYDAIYNSTLNQKTCIDHAIRKIVQGAPTEIAMETLFDSKKIVFRMCWPEYYAAHYEPPTPWDVFNATGSTKSGLIRAGRIKEVVEDLNQGRGADVTQSGRFSAKKTERRRNYNHGSEVDKVVYWAMREVLSFFEMKTSELFLSLADPKASGWSKYGFVQIIEARGCYPTPLDFYMLNSPQEFQMNHIEEYMQAREKAGLSHIKALDMMYEAYQKTRKEYQRELELDDRERDWD